MLGHTDNSLPASALPSGAPWRWAVARAGRTIAPPQTSRGSARQRCALRAAILTRFGPLAQPARRLALLLAALYGGALALRLGGGDVIFDQQQIVNGLSAGAIYGSLALALVMIYRATGVINLALGETSTFGAFLAWTAIVSAGVNYWAGFLIAVVASALLSAALELALLQQLTRRGPLTMIVVSAGLLGLVRDLDSIVWGDRPRAFPTPFQGPVLHAYGLFVPRARLGTFLVVCAAVATLAWLFQRTRLGLALRATALRPEAAQLCGVPVRWMRTIGWGLSGALGTVAGVLIAHLVILEPRMLEGGIVYALAAAALGGLDSPAGALIGGVMVGVMDAVIGGTGAFKAIRLPAVAVLVFVLLAVWPNGILGQRPGRNL